MQVKKERVYIDDVAVDVFYDRATDFTKQLNAVISLCGFPDFAGPNELTAFQVKLGNIVFQPHMKGTFDSGGKFGPQGFIDTLKALNIVIWDKRASDFPMDKKELKPWKIKKLTLIGHSFGGMIELRYFPYIKNLDSIIFISPAVHYAEKYGCDEIGPEHYAEVRRKYPYTYRLEDPKKWNGILEGLDSLPLSPIGQVTTVYVVYGSKDRYFDVPKARMEVPGLIKSYIKANNHSFYIAEGAGHPLAEILSDNEAANMIKTVSCGE